MATSWAGLREAGELRLAVRTVRTLQTGASSGTNGVPVEYSPKGCEVEISLSGLNAAIHSRRLTAQLKSRALSNQTQADSFSR